MARIRGSKYLEIEDFVVFYSRHCELIANLHELILKHSVVAKSDLIYGDSVHPTEKKEMSYQLRPGWSPERLRSHCYVGDVVVASQDLVDQVGGVKFLRKLSPHDRALRLSEVAKHPVHLNTVLYYSPLDRSFPTADMAAVRSHCSRVGIDADCVLSEDGSVVKVLRRLSNEPKVCVVIPTRGDSTEIRGKRVNLAANAISSLCEKSTYRNFEIIAVIDTVATDESRQEIIDAGGKCLSVIDFDEPFNFAKKINIAALQTDADYLLFMNDDIEIFSPEVIQNLLSYFQDSQVGIVAPLLLFENERVQSAGHLMNPVPFDLYRGYEAESTAGFNILQVAREVSSVIAAFAITPTDLFLEAGGFCIDFPGDYNDVDYALKIKTLGKKAIFTPYVKCWHFESMTRKPGLNTSAIELLGTRWKHEIENDFYGNPLLQKYEFIWKANVDSSRSLADAVGGEAEWDEEEWRFLQTLPDRNIHRTMFFPQKIRWKN
jgi:O-antigen biosynthesis protein